MNRFAVVGSILFSFWAMGDVIAQQASVQIRSADSIPFFLMLSGHQVNDSAMVSVQLDSIRAKEYPIDILFSDSTTHFSSAIDPEDGMMEVYEIQKLGKDFALLLFSTSKRQNETTSNVSELVFEAVADSSLDSLTIAPTGIPGYIGPTGCQGIIDDIAQKELKDELEHEFFESKRKKLIAQKAKNDCLTVAQFADLLRYIELEDYKLELINECKDELYDQKNLADLAKSLQFESSRSKLRTILGK